MANKADNPQVRINHQNIEGIKKLRERLGVATLTVGAMVNDLVTKQLKTQGVKVK